MLRAVTVFIMMLIFSTVVVAAEAMHMHHDMTPAKKHYSDDEIKDLFNRCVDMPVSFEKTICLRPYFQAMTQKYSAKRSIDQAQQLVKEGVIEDCHMAAHVTGIANVIKYDYDLKAALSSCSMDCIEGCVHGVMQTYISHKLGPSQVTEDVQHICDDARDDPWLHRQCVHGIGHGFVTDGFMPVKEAIRSCNLFKDEDVDNCLGGLFMENMHPVLMWPEEKLRTQLFSVCAEVVAMHNTAYTQYCIDGIGEGLMFYSGHDLAKSLGYCELLPKEHWAVCQSAAIAEAANAPSTFDVKACDLARKDQQAICRSLQPVKQQDSAGAAP